MSNSKFDAARILKVLSQENRYWFDLEGRGEIYLRTSVREIESEQRSGLDLASVAVRQAFQRRGVFTAAIAVIEQAAIQMNRSYVFVESIFNPILIPVLQSFGYTVLRRVHGPFLIDGHVYSAIENVDAYKLIGDFSARERAT